MYYIILNPASKSGRGIQIWKRLKPVFEQRNLPYKLIISKYSGHIAESVRKLTKNIPENAALPLNLIILGGDGTVNEVLQGIQDFSKVCLGYIPTGSSNDLARDMRLPKKPEEILERILSGQFHRTLDLGVLTYDEHSQTTPRLKDSPMDKRRYFVISSGIGFDAAVCEEALASPTKDALNRFKLGKLTYLSIALRQLISAKPVSCDIYLDDKPPIHLNRFLFTASMIHKYEGGGFQFCPQADPQDGLLDVFVAGNLPKALILLALPTAFFGKHYIFPQLFHYQAQKVGLKTSVPLWVHTDGEVPIKSDHIYLLCQKQKITFLA